MQRPNALIQRITLASDAVVQAASAAVAPRLLPCLLVSYRPLAPGGWIRAARAILGAPEPKKPYLAPYVPTHQCCCLALQEMPKKAAPAHRGAVEGGERLDIHVKKEDKTTALSTTARELGIRIKDVGQDDRIEFRIKRAEYNKPNSVGLDFALVEGRQRICIKPLRTVQLLGKQHVVRAYDLDFDRDAMRERTQKSRNEVGTAARASEWHSGVPEDVQALLEADVVDEEALLQIFRTRYVDPSQFRALQNCHLRHCTFKNKWGRCPFHFGSKGAAKGAEDKCAKQGAVNAITYRKGDWDTSAFFKSLPKWMQKGAKDSKEGFPWTGPRGDGRLDDYKVPDERGQQTKVRRDGTQTHWAIGASGGMERARDPAAAQRMAEARPWVSTPRGKCFDMTRSPRRH